MLAHARREADGLFRFRFRLHPLDADATVESDTPYALLPATEAAIFVARRWARPLTDEEARRINAGAVAAATEDGMSAEDRAAAAELEAEERTRLAHAAAEAAGKSKPAPKGK